MRMPRDKTPYSSALQAAWLLLLGLLLQYLLGAAFYDLRQTLGLSDDQANTLALLLANGILITGVMHVQGLGHRDLLHPSKQSPWVLFAGLVPAVLLLLPLILLLDGVLMAALEAMLPVSDWEQRAFRAMTTPTLSAVIATCVIAPVVEEMLFRGILLRGFLAQYPRGPAIGFSALYFGFVHFNIYQYVGAFWMGLLLGWLYERSRSLIPCIALHVGVNGAVVALHLFTDSDSALEKLWDPYMASIVVWLAAAVAAALGAWILHKMFSTRARKTTHGA
jgi:uncharacterized protein